MIIIEPVANSYFYLPRSPTYRYCQNKVINMSTIMAAATAAVAVTVPSSNKQLLQASWEVVQVVQAGRTQLCRDCSQLACTASCRSPYDGWATRHNQVQSGRSRQSRYEPILQASPSGHNPLQRRLGTVKSQLTATIISQNPVNRHHRHHGIHVWTTLQLPTLHWQGLHSHWQCGTASRHQGSRSPPTSGAVLMAPSLPKPPMPTAQCDNACIL